MKMTIRVTPLISLLSALCVGVVPVAAQTGSDGPLKKMLTIQWTKGPALPQG